MRSWMAPESKSPSFFPDDASHEHLHLRAGVPRRGIASKMTTTAFLVADEVEVEAGRPAHTDHHPWTVRPGTAHHEHGHPSGEAIGAAAEEGEEEDVASEQHTGDRTADRGVDLHGGATHALRTAGLRRGLLPVEATAVEIVRHGGKVEAHAEGTLGEAAMVEGARATVLMVVPALVIEAGVGAVDRPGSMVLVFSNE